MSDNFIAIADQPSGKQVATRLSGELGPGSTDRLIQVVEVAGLRKYTYSDFNGWPELSAADATAMEHVCRASIGLGVQYAFVSGDALRYTDFGDWEVVVSNIGGATFSVAIYIDGDLAAPAVPVVEYGQCVLDIPCSEGQVSVLMLFGVPVVGTSAISAGNLYRRLVPVGDCNKYVVTIKHPVLVGGFVSGKIMPVLLALEDQSMAPSYIVQSTLPPKTLTNNGVTDGYGMPVYNTLSWDLDGAATHVLWLATEFSGDSVFVDGVCL